MTQNRQALLSQVSCSMLWASMKTTVLSYTVIIRKEGKEFVAHVPTLGISDFGASVDAAKKNIQAAIACHIEGLGKTGTALAI